MEKPLWRRRASTFVVDSPHLRLRVDELELPDGTVVADYYVRESEGFVVVFPVTADDRIVLVRQYRYGTDAIHLELPAGGLHAGEDPRDCAARELREETGYEATSWNSSVRTFPSRFGRRRRRASFWRPVRKKRATRIPILPKFWKSSSLPSPNSARCSQTARSTPATSWLRDTACSIGSAVCSRTCVARALEARVVTVWPTSRIGAAGRFGF